MITPIKDRVVVKPENEEGETKTAIGVVLPAGAAPEQHTGTVLAVGPLVNELFKGDQVLYSRYAGIDVEDDGEDLLILREPDVLAVKRKAK